jgi:hypothetical protein
MDRDVVILDPVLELDAYGQWVPSGTFTRRTVRGWVAQLTAQEMVEPGRLANVTRWEGLLPAGTAIGDDDSLEVDGIPYMVDGPPNRVRRPGRGEWYVHIQLRRVTG